MEAPQRSQRVTHCQNPTVPQSLEETALDNVEEALPTGGTVASPVSTQTSSPRKIDLSISRCILHTLPPEIRKEIFKVILAKFFQDRPERQYIRYGVRNNGKPIYRDDPFNISKAEPKIYAGFCDKRLSNMELALFAEPMLHGEFVTTRVEMSTITLMPSILKVRRSDLDIRVPASYWPKLCDISPHVRASIRSVLYEVELERQAYDRSTEQYLPVDDARSRMHRLARHMKSMSVQNTVHIPHDPNAAGINHELLPLLRHVSIRFPEETLGAGYDFRAFETHRNRLLDGLKKLFKSFRIKTFQFVALRTYNDFEDFEETDEGEDLDWYFGCLDVALDSAFGIDGNSRIEFVDNTFEDDDGDEDLICLDDAEMIQFDVLDRQLYPRFKKQQFYECSCECMTDETYEISTTWTAPGGFLTWND